MGTADRNEAVGQVGEAGGVYMGEWKDGGFLSMVADFSDIYMTRAEYEANEAPYSNAQLWLEKKAELKSALESERFANIEVVLADYETPPYEGDAFVLFKRDGKLYEVNGSHCSCYGLEGQWDPEEVTADVLLGRLEKSTYGRFHENQAFRSALRAALRAVGAAK